MSREDGGHSGDMRPLPGEEGRAGKAEGRVPSSGVPGTGKQCWEGLGARDSGQSGRRPAVQGTLGPGSPTTGVLKRCYAPLALPRRPTSGLAAREA